MEIMESMYADLFEAAGAGRRQGEAMAARAGQTQARWQVMWIVSSGEYTVPQVARRLGVSRQGVQRVATELLEASLLATAANPDHRTSPLLVLTDEGRETLARIDSVADETHQRMLELFPASDVEALRDLLQRFLGAVKVHDGTMSTGG